MIIDAQLHEPGAQLDWPDSDPESQNKVMTELTVSWMDSVGVDRGILHPGDPEWGKHASSHFPDRFATVPMFPPVEDTGEPFETVLARYRSENATIKGIRMIVGFPATGENDARVKAGDFDALLEVCAADGLPVFMFITRYLDTVKYLVEKFPTINFIVDHYGLPQSPFDEPDTPRFSRLDDLLALSDLPTVHVKACGAPALSVEGYPYGDVWPSIDKIIAAFGAERLLWASDMSRFFGRIGFHGHLQPAIDGYVGKHTTAESIGFFRYASHLSQEQKDLILGGTAARLLGWQ